MAGEARMSGGQPGLWDLHDRLRELSAQGDPLEKLPAPVDFEIFRGEFWATRGTRDRAKGGRPAFDPVLKVRMLVLQAISGLSLAQTEYRVADRPSWMRSCGLGPGDAVPDANTLPAFREALIAAGAPEGLFTRLHAAITGAGYLPMAGQVGDATMVAAPRQRNTEAATARIKAGETAAAIWPDNPAKTRQGHTDARWTATFSKANPAADGKPLSDVAIPTNCYKAHISIDRRQAVTRRGKTNDAAAHDGARRREGLIDQNNTAFDVWADIAYRSAENERYLAGIHRVSRTHRRKPRGRSMARHHARANAAKSVVRAHVVQPLAQRKGIMGLVIRIIGLARGDGGCDAVQHGLEHEAVVLARRARCASVIRKPERRAATATPRPAQPRSPRRSERPDEHPASHARRGSGIPGVATWRRGERRFGDGMPSEGRFRGNTENRVWEGDGCAPVGCGGAGQINFFA
jgi:IS5 family transposase